MQHRGGQSGRTTKLYVEFSPYALRPNRGIPGVPLCPRSLPFASLFLFSPGWLRTENCPRDHFPFSSKLLLIFLIPESLTRTHSALKYFERLRRQTLLTVSHIAAHLSMGIFTGKHCRVSASSGWGWTGWEMPKHFCHGDELGSFLCPILGCISPHLHLLVWGLPVHWQNVYLRCLSFKLEPAFPPIYT